MDTSKLKNYAPKARQEFIQAVTDRAGVLGLSESGIEPVEVRGDVALIGGRDFPAEVAKRRREIETRINRNGFSQVMEEEAYTWFNRFMALRYMELHDYLGHGCRVLSNPGESDIPEILEKATSVDLPGLDREKAAELRLAGNKDADLYRLLLLTQCNALNRVMPFLFEPISDVSELLMPENLLQTNSPIRNLVNEIPEEDWREIEIVGWLYQFYISEKKSRVIGKTVKSEDIPAATQLFTPNWIVKYMVQNTLGRKWLMTYPESSIRDKMEFYIQPAEQEPQVQAKLNAVTPGELNPEELTFMDPACGSGHILAEAYDLFKAIYQERGYRTRDIPGLILQKNLFGLDIDDRAAQLARFTVLMKARADNRRILDPEKPVRLNVFALQESKGIEADRATRELSRVKKSGELTDAEKDGLEALLRLFEDGKTFGSLLTVPEKLKTALPQLEELINAALVYDEFSRGWGRSLMPLIRQARLLGAEYNFVVANPPYMGNKGLNAELKEFAKSRYPDSKSDLFAMFIERNLDMAQPQGYAALITMQSWMFLSSFEKLRSNILDSETIISMAHLGARAFDSISGEVVQTTAFVLYNEKLEKYKGIYLRLVEEKSEESKIDAIRAGEANRYTASGADFKKIPGNPIAYWASKLTIDCFTKKTLQDNGKVCQGLLTTDNELYLRRWYEISVSNCGFKMNRKQAIKSNLSWFPINKGGEYRKWYGNLEFIVKWEKDGENLHQEVIRKYPYLKNNSDLVLKRSNPYFEPAITWNDISSSYFSARYMPIGMLFEKGGSCVYTEDLTSLLGYLCSKVSSHFLRIMNPTLHFQVGNIKNLPFDVDLLVNPIITQKTINTLCDIAITDWNSHEISWDFDLLPLLGVQHKSVSKSIPSSYSAINSKWHQTTQEMKRLEEENNHFFIEAYGLQDELTPDIPLEEITLTCNPYYRYGGNKSEEELESLLRADTMKELISYAIGCMMGRYSLDEPGLIYAHSGNEGFDPGRYQTFPADEDGIVPVMDDDFFEDDATNRFVEFIRVAWPPESLDENLKFVADSLGPKKSEDPIDTIRRYISDKFFKDHHLKLYKKRPIYWLFSSGKQKAFQCLVYLHRYNESTLSRMRAMYVTPLQGKYKARVEYLENERDAAGSVSSRKKIEKELNIMRKKQEELREYDELLRHYADQRISLDLDDGVKANYGKFGNLLAEVKAVTGKKAGE